MSHTHAQPPTPVWLWIMPAAVVGVLALAVSSLLDGLEPLLLWLLPFLITLWVGAGFTFAWDMLRYHLHIQRAS
jgi:hypothetical protein